VADLEARQLKAALLRHQGKKWQDIADTFEISISTAKSWARLPAFKTEIERLKKGEQVRAESELSAALDQRMELSSKLWDFCNARIDEINESCEQADPLARWRQLPGLTKALAEVVKLTLETENQALGLETIVSDLDGITSETQS